MKRRFITVADVIIAAAVVAVAVFALLVSSLNRSDRLIAEITCGGQTEKIDLSSVKEEYDINITSNGHDLTLNVGHNSIEVVSSSCPDKVCVATGKLDRHGDCAVCLPARFTVRLYGNDTDDSGVDVIL